MRPAFLYVARLGVLCAALVPSLAEACENCYNGCYVARETPQDIQMIMGDIVVNPDTAVGQRIAIGYFPIEQDKGLTCMGTNAMVGELPGSKLSSLGDNIYETNIAGIGIRLYREGERYIDVYYPHYLQGQNHPQNSSGRAYLEGGLFTVELIRLPGQVGAGPLKPGLYSTYWGDGSGPNRPILTSHVIGNSIRIVNAACKLDAGSRNIPINMGEVSKGAFKGVGSTLNERPFMISMSCVGGHESQWSTRKSDVGISFEYDADPSGAAGVIKNTASSDAAQGVGIQLLEASNGMPIAPHRILNVGQLRDSSDRYFNIGLTSRYYQTSSNISGGNVRSLATFNIVYQ